MPFNTIVIFMVESICLLSSGGPRMRLVVRLMSGGGGGGPVVTLMPGGGGGGPRMWLVVTLMPILFVYHVMQE